MHQSVQPDKFSHTDETLIEMLRSDQEWALRAIFDRYHNSLFGIAESVLRDQDTAKDMVQEVFIDLWNRRHESDIRKLSHYLKRAVKFQVLKYIRDANHRDKYIQVMESIQFVNQTEQMLDADELENSLRAAIDQLSPRCREVFLLSRYENLSHKEIALRLKISPKTIEIQITKALHFLRKFLDKAIIISALISLF